MSNAHLSSRAARGADWVYGPRTVGIGTSCSTRPSICGRIGPASPPRCAASGNAEFARREESGQRLIAANGITYNIYGDPQGKERPWLMDLIPLVIDAGEWAQIERAVIQRATLLNTMLGDLYGPQRLLRDGLLPPESRVRQPQLSASLPRRPSASWRRTSCSTVCICIRSRPRSRQGSSSACK